MTQGNARKIQGKQQKYQGISSGESMDSFVRGDLKPEQKNDIGKMYLETFVRALSCFLSFAQNENGNISVYIFVSYKHDHKHLAEVFVVITNSLLPGCKHKDKHS